MTDARQIPGPEGHWLVGNLTDFARDPLNYLYSQALRHGDVVKLRFVRKNMYLLNRPDYIREVLVAKPDSFHKGRGLQHTKPVLGEGLLTSEGETHRRHRRLMQPAFHMRRISEYADTMVDYASKMLNQWQDGEVRLISKDMMDVTLSIITKTMFGFETPSETDEIGRAIDTLFQRVMKKTRSPFSLPDFVPTKGQKEFLQAKATLDAIIYRILSTRRGQDGDYGDLLSMLLQTRDEEDGTGLSNHELRDEVMTIFLAGHETTANTLSWTLYLLARNPQVERKLHEELDSVLAGERPQMAHLARLPYTQMVIKESMRLFPAAWIVGYQATTDVQIGEWDFQRGDSFFMSQYVMHRNPKYYEQPEDFLPERWTPEFAKSLPSFAYFPFGGGPRVCIGNQFALMEATLLLVTIGQRYRLELADAKTRVMSLPMITLRPKDGIYMRVYARHL